MDSCLIIIKYYIQKYRIQGMLGIAPLRQMTFLHPHTSNLASKPSQAILTSVSPQCIPPPPPGAAPGLFLLSRNARSTSPNAIHDSSMYTS